MDTRSVTLAAELLDSSTASISRALKKCVTHLTIRCLSGLSKG
ncbi:hypothetical protein N4G58_12915 [Edwardsiella piscicida]|nr:hypothetical protein N4G58_12915 [Edwardsiella piscicida]